MGPREGHRAPTAHTAAATGEVIGSSAAAEIPSFAPGSEHFAQLAHEMRGPLMALATSAEVLSDDVDMLERAQIREVAKAMRSRALWLQGLLENVLCAAAVQAGRFRLQLQRVNPVDVVEEVRVLLAPVLEQRQHALRVQVRRAPAGRRQSEPEEVEADGRRIGQVLVNLVLNASKYSDRGTPIDVVVGPHGDFLRVTVADRGRGLPPGGAARLFEPFHRGAHPEPDGSGQPAPDGVGLGLAIARAIVDAHGGRIGARNRPGGGALFWVDLRPAPKEAKTGRR